MKPRTQLLIGLVSLALSATAALVRDRLPEATGSLITDAPRRLADVLLPRESDVISAVVPNGTTVAGRGALMTAGLGDNTSLSARRCPT